MPYVNTRPAKAVAGPSSYPGSGNTFYIQFLDGSYTRLTGNQTPTYVGRRAITSTLCHNIRNTLPPENTIIEVFEWKGYWWTDFAEGTSPQNAIEWHFQQATAGLWNATGGAAPAFNTYPISITADGSGTSDVYYPDFGQVGFGSSQLVKKWLEPGETHPGQVSGRVGGTMELLADGRYEFRIFLPFQKDPTVEPDPIQELQVELDINVWTPTGSPPFNLSDYSPATIRQSCPVMMTVANGGLQYHAADSTYSSEFTQYQLVGFAVSARTAENWAINMGGSIGYPQCMIKKLPSGSAIT